VNIPRVMDDTLGVGDIFSDGVSESISRSTTVNCGLEASLDR
jgi:hypothetical protein